MQYGSPSTDEVYSLASEAAKVRPVDGLMFLERAQNSAFFNQSEIRSLQQAELSLFSVNKSQIPNASRRYLRNLSLVPLVIIDTNILVDALIDRIAKKLHLVGEISLDIQGQGSFHKILLSKARDKKLQLWLPDVVKQELTGIASGLNYLRSRFDDSLVSPELLDQIFNEKTLTGLTNEVLEDYNSRNLGEVLKTITGVSTLNSGNYLSKPVINGLHSSRIILINNDVRLEDQEWGIEHAPSIDINSIDKISVIKGASALKYAGDAVGGVIIAETSREKLLDSIYGNITSNVQSNGRGGALSTNFTKTNSNGWFYKLQGTLKRMGDFETPNYVMTNTGFAEHNFSFKAGLNRIDHGIDIYYSLFSNKLGILRSSHAHTAIDIILSLIHISEPTRPY